MDEHTLIARFVIPALISAVISLIVAVTTSIIQTKNNNKSIEAASKRLEETHKYQLERDEENRKHTSALNKADRQQDIKIKNRDIKLQKLEELHENLDKFFIIYNDCFNTNFIYNQKPWSEKRNSINNQPIYLLIKLYFPHFEDEIQQLLELSSSQINILLRIETFALEHGSDGKFNKLSAYKIFAKMAEREDYLEFERLTDKVRNKRKLVLKLLHVEADELLNLK